MPIVPEVNEGRFWHLTREAECATMAKTSKAVIILDTGKSIAAGTDSLVVPSKDVLWDCLDGLCLRERESHPTLGKPEELLALMLKKR